MRGSLARHARRARRAARAAAMSLAVSACSLVGLDGRCGDESREVLTSTRFAEPGDPQAGYAQFDLVERRHDAPRQSMGWLLYSASLRGHIQGARVVDLGANGAVLVELPVTPGPDSATALQGGGEPYAGPTPFEHLFARVLAGEAALHLDTNVPGRERLQERLQVNRFKDWSQPYCS